jgi:hypothetical protein
VKVYLKESKMTEIKYNPMFLDMVKELSKISPKILFVKSGESVLVRHKENEISFVLKTPDGSFDFNSTRLGFLDFSKFYDLYKIFKNPTLTLSDEGKVFIQSGPNKVTFVPSNPDLIRNTFNEMVEVDNVLVFSLTKEQLSNLNKMIGKINPGASGSAYATVQLVDGVLKMVLSNKAVPNTFEMEIELEDKTVPNVEAKFSCDILARAPENDYIISVSETAITLNTKNNYELTMRTGLHYEENDE